MLRSLKDIRWVVISFSICLALMLYQTPYLNLGTITALASMGLTTIFLVFTLSKQGTRMSVPVSLVLFLLFSTISTFANHIEPELWKVILQILFCVLMSSLRLTNKESTYFEWAFSLALTVYAVFIIRECSTNVARYYHGDIELFNTEFDPNYIAIPIVCAMILMLGNVLNKNKRVISGTLFAVMAVSLMYTASRGAFLGLISGMSVVLYYSFFKGKGASRFFSIFLFAILAYILVRYMFINFEDATGRITDVNNNDEIDNGRLAIWNLSFNKWLENPLFGFGIGGNYRIIGVANHNTYVEVLFCTGLLGTITFISFVVSLFKKAIKSSPVYLALMISLVIQIFFLDSLSNRCLWLLFTWMAMLPNNKAGFDTQKQTIARNRM